MNVDNHENSFLKGDTGENGERLIMVFCREYLYQVILLIYIRTLKKRKHENNYQ